MFMETHSTNDIWLSAFFLTEANAKLVNISKTGRETISFSFYGKNLSKLAHSYYQDQAKANVTLLRAKINELRDIIFESKRN